MKNSSSGLHRFAIVTAVCTFFLVIAGGLVTSTGSGLSVPDWPLSYGQLMPPMVGGVFYEHGHRMVATFVGMLTVVLTVWLVKREERQWVKNLGIAGLLAVIVQGVLGGLTVLLLLPTPVSVLHATLAQSFFSLTVVIALVTSPGWRGSLPAIVPGSSRTQTLGIVATAMVLLQLMLGAWMRHSDAGLAITDFPLSYGSLLPPATSAALESINSMRLEHGLAPVLLSQIWVHFAHRVGALLTCTLELWFVLHILTSYRNEQRLREPAIAIGVLVLVQALLGALTVWTGKGVEIATSHVAIGALLLAMTTFLTVRCFGLLQRPAPSHSAAMEVSLSRP